MTSGALNKSYFVKLINKLYLIENQKLISSINTLHEFVEVSLQNFNGGLISDLNNINDCGVNKMQSFLLGERLDTHRILNFRPK